MAKKINIQKPNHFNGDCYSILLKHILLNIYALPIEFLHILKETG